ncbi:MAG: LuxR C-terminal-related transcriptional regulator [Thiomicrorhabdus sp.]|jgi:hypothetical protein|nr:LuxR C-terminal-related transcriptional regulator [Thiomicrorhabdus sp.]
MNKVNYLEYCISEREIKVIESIDDGKKQKTIAKELDIHPRTVRKIITRVKARATIQGENPEASMNVKVPNEYYVKGTSTMYKDGVEKLQWVKTNVKAESLIQIAESVVESLMENIAGKSNPTPFNKKLPQTDDYLTVYPIGDPHIGMYAWKDETGNEFDTEIAIRQLTGATDYLISCALPTKQALVINLGDLTHGDNNTNSTPRSGNVLDIDTRWAKILRIAVDALIYAVDAALVKHENVKMINEIGNHDTHTSYVVSLIMDAYYRNNPRVDIDLSPATYHYYRFHDVLIGVTHGDGAKLTDLGPIMATDMAKDWGETTKRYWLVGHIHHIHKKELHGCVVESFRTLAAKDAWHSSAGYRAGRDMCTITYHREFGEVARATANIDMIEALENI